MAGEAARRYDSLPIAGKLRRMSIVASSAALMLACAAFILFDVLTFNDAMVRNLGSDAELVAMNVAPALLFSDPDSAAATLAALRAKKSVRFAALYDREGKLFASYLRDGPEASGQVPLRLPQQAGDRFSWSRLVLTEPVMAGQDRVGSVYLDAELSELWRRVQTFLAIVAVVLTISLLLGVAIAGSLAARISMPILGLVATARAIAEHKDYTRRAPAGRGDELGELADSFNLMLDQIEQREASLQRTNRELEDFARVASHDLQEPLRKIQAFGERLRERQTGGLDEQARDYVRRMQESAGRMRALVEELLNFSRAAGPVRMFREVDLSAVVQDVLSDLQLRVEQSGARIDVEPLPRIDADPTQMYQLLQNLLSNALKFRRPDAPLQIAVRAHDVDGSEGRMCRLTVEDNGIGFEQKYAERIFSVFKRLHGRNEYEGTGMGLAICRKIVDQHNGTIEAHGDPGRGARFIVTLPYQQRTKGARQ
jgi:signal transduction histidine kinase